MINLLRAEFYKLRRSTAFIMCMIVTTVCAISLAALTHAVLSGDFDIPITSMTGLSDIFIMSVVGSLMTSILICSDFDSKNIHDAISRGRLSIIISKSIIYIFVISMLVLPYAVVGFVGFASKGEFQMAFPYSTYLSLMANPMNLAVDSDAIGKAIEILLISLILYAARLSICIPFAYKIRKSVAVTVIGVVFGFITDFLVSVLSKIPVLDKVIEYTPFSYQLLSMDMKQGELLKILGISILFLGIIIAITYALFRRDEIK